MTGVTRRAPGVPWLLVVALVLAACGSAPPGTAPASATGRTFAPLASPTPTLAATPTPVPVGRLASTGRVAIVSVDSSAIAIIDAAGVTATTIEAGAEGGGFAFPAWSPDGERLAVIRITDAGRSLRVYDLSAVAGAMGAPASTTIFDRAGIAPFYLSWRPDGEAIAFLASATSGLTLRMAAPDATTADVIVGDGEPFYFDWLSAERLVAHVGSGPDAFLGELGLSGGEAGTALPGEPGMFRAPVTNHDASALAFVRGADASDIVLADRDGTDLATMPVFGPAAVAFEPAGSRLAGIGSLVATEGTLPIGPLRLLDPATGDATVLQEGEVVGFWWSPDATTIATIRVDRSAERPEVRLGFIDVDAGKVRGELRVGLTESFIDNILTYFDQYATSHHLWSPDSESFLVPVIEDAGANVVRVVSRDAQVLARIDGSLGVWSP